jgi:hypothetical protein
MSPPNHRYGEQEEYLRKKRRRRILNPSESEGEHKAEPHFPHCFHLSIFEGKKEEKEGKSNSLNHQKIFTLLILARLI